MTKLVHFEITTEDVEATSQFYATVFDWTAQPSGFIDGYNLLDTGDPGVTGAVMSRKYRTQPFIPWFDVDFIEDAVGTIERAGGKAVNEKATLPGMAYVIYVADPEGNIFGLRQAIGDSQ